MARDEFSGKITRVVRMGESYMANVDTDELLGIGLHRDGTPPRRGDTLRVVGEGAGHVGGRVEEIYLNGVRQPSAWEEWQATRDGTDEPDYS